MFYYDWAAGHHNPNHLFDRYDAGFLVFLFIFIVVMGTIIYRRKF